MTISTTSQGEPPKFQEEFRDALKALIDGLPSSTGSASGSARQRVRNWFLRRVGANRYVTKQDLIARLGILDRDLARLPSEVASGFYFQAQNAALILQKSTESLAAAEQLTWNMERTLSRTAALRSIMWGLLIYIVITLLIVTIYARNLVPNPGAVEAGMIGYEFANITVHFPTGYIFACVFGVLGSIVSIFFRLSEFESLTGRSRPFLMLTGAFLPIVGSVFAVVVYAMFRSGLFKVSLGDVEITESPRIEVAMILGFLCGFSERFARGMLERVAGAKDEPGDGAKAA